jgi:predicted ATPase
LLLGAYRDHELDPGHRLAALLAELRNAPRRRWRSARPLTSPDVAALLRDTLATPDVDDLARELVHRTHGNPLFIREFLRFLHREHCCPRRGARRLGLGPHQRRRDARSPTASPPSRRRAAPAAAGLAGGPAIGLVPRHSLRRRHARAHPRRRHRRARALLQPAIDLDLIIPLHPSYRLLAHAQAAELQLSVPLRFLHDRVRQAAYALIPEDERPARHALVGRRLLARARSEDHLHEALFDIVAHLNEATELLAADERDDLAALDLAAACRAKASAAYDSALVLLAAGIAALGSDAWRRRRALSFALYSEQAECEYLSGAPDRALARLDQIEPHAQDGEQRLQLADLRVVLHASMGNTRGALQAGLAGLAAAGVEIPADDAACRAEAAEELARIEADLARTPLDALVEAPRSPTRRSAACSSCSATRWPRPT